MTPFTPEKLPITIDYSGLVAEMGKANRALAHYNALIGEFPNPDLLLASLVRREAMLSSRIEGSQSTLDEILQFEDDPTFVAKGEQRDDLNEIVNYVNALITGEMQLSVTSFSLYRLKVLHKQLLGFGSVRGQNKNPGAFRTKQVWIGTPGASQAQATFVPPEPIFIQEFMENWETFCLSSQPDALVQVAVLHAQFELIHPFEDGNGRLGRLVIPLFLWNKKILSQPHFYPSAYLERERDAYMHALKELNAKPGNWQGWIRFFLQAITTQATEDSERIKQMMSLYEEMKRRVVDLTHSQFAVPVLDAMFRNPIFRNRDIAKRIGTKLDKPPSGPTLNSLLRKLSKHKILQIISEGKGRRATVYELTDLMELLREDG